MDSLRLMKFRNWIFSEMRVGDPESSMACRRKSDADVLRALPAARMKGTKRVVV